MKSGRYGKMVRWIQVTFVKGQDLSGDRPEVAPVYNPVDVPAARLAGEAVKRAWGFCFKHLLESVGLKGFEGR